VQRSAPSKPLLSRSPPSTLTHPHPLPHQADLADAQKAKLQAQCERQDAGLALADLEKRAAALRDAQEAAARELVGAQTRLREEGAGMEKLKDKVEHWRRVGGGA